MTNQNTAALQNAQSHRNFSALVQPSNSSDMCVIFRERLFATAHSNPLARVRSFAITAQCDQA